MVRWLVVVCAASLAPLVHAAEPSPPPKAAPAKAAAKRRAKPVKPPEAVALPPKPLHLGLNGLGPHRHRPEWHLESVPAPGIGPNASSSGVRALALVSPVNDEQRIEVGVAPLTPIKLPSSLSNGPDGMAATRASKPLKSAQVYLRYSW